MKATEQKKQAHGLTHDEMKELHYKQIAGEKIEMIPANNASDIKDPYFKDEYTDHEIPAHESHIYHVAEEARTFRNQGAVPEKTSFSTVQKYTKEAFEFMKKNHGFDGKIVHILHNPVLDEVKGRKEKQELKEEVVGEQPSPEVLVMEGGKPVDKEKGTIADVPAKKRK